MTARRIVMIVAGLSVAALGIVFLVLGLDRADKVASVVGSLAGLAGLAVSAIALVGPGRSGRPGVTVQRTGSIVQRSTGGSTSRATTGVELGGAPPADGLAVADTGAIEQDGGGDAVTGVRS